MDSDYFPAALSMLSEEYRQLIENGVGNGELEVERAQLYEEVKSRVNQLDPWYAREKRQEALDLGINLEDVLFNQVLRVALERYIQGQKSKPHPPKQHRRHRSQRLRMIISHCGSGKSGAIAIALRTPGLDLDG